MEKKATIEKTFDLALQNHNENKFQIAIKLYLEVLRINSNHVKALNNLGTIFHAAGKHNEAINCYNKIIQIDPKNSIYHNNLAASYQEKREYDKALNHLKKSLELNPEYAAAHSNLSSLYMLLDEYQKAITCSEDALKIDPGLIDAQKNISAIHVSQLKNIDLAVTSSHKALKMFHKQSKFINQSVRLFRLKHDVQQAKYLGSKNYEIDGLDQFQKVGDEILNRKENKDDQKNHHKKIALTSEEISALLPFYKSDYVYKPKKISTNGINPNINWQSIENEYLNSSNQVMFIDDFLSEEALIELREFCLVSKVWTKEYNNKFLGAFSNIGFVSPLHLQIAIDLQQKLPKLFGPHGLGQFWGYKYDATLGKGINIHADFALHNLNFWITPDEYNNNKNSGGLKVYDSFRPDNWTYKDYNSNSDKIYKFINDNNQKYTNVSYKYNRAVLFNSRYFHETDEIDFKDEYEGRRINNTYLFGKW